MTTSLPPEAQEWAREAVDAFMAAHLNLTPSSAANYATVVNSAKDEVVRDLFSGSSDLLGIRVSAFVLEFGSIASLLAVVAADCHNMPPVAYFDQLRRALRGVDELTPMERAVVVERLNLS
jgi:hypothetical protein